MRIYLSRLFASLMLLVGLQAHAGIPTFDGAGLIQTTTTALESVAQTTKQIADYKLQLDQYENMLKNSMAPAAYIWDKAQETIGNLQGAMNTLNSYKNMAGNLDSYLDKFQNTNYYRSSPCFKAVSTGCTAEEWQKIRDQEDTRSDLQKRANDSLIRSLDEQQKAIEKDAKQLEKLQKSAQGAEGQMAAIQNASMIAANSGNQLLQIRSLMVSQHNALAAQMQAKSDQEAMQRAASQKALSGTTFRSMPARTW